MSGKAGSCAMRSHEGDLGSLLVQGLLKAELHASPQSGQGAEVFITSHPSVFKTGVLSFGTADIWGGPSVLGASVHCRAPTHKMILPSFDNTECLLMWSNVPWGAELPLVESTGGEGGVSLPRHF